MSIVTVRGTQTIRGTFVADELVAASGEISGVNLKLTCCAIE